MESKQQWVWTQKICEEIFNDKYKFDRENIEEVIQQIVKEISLAEKTKVLQKEWEKKFYDVLISGKFIPAGRNWSNARVDSKIKNYLNCFVISIDDNMESIYNAIKDDAIISKFGGGVGLNISKLRPKDDKLSRGGKASGTISFLKVFNESAKIIMTGGERRGAHIAILNIDHPDIEEFITIKQGDKNKELTQFNLSVGITNKFIDAYEKDLDWNLVFNNKIYKTIKARYLYNLLSQNSFINNEPGIFNIDIANKYNNLWYIGKVDAVNPCITGDTLIAVADGRNAISIHQLVEEEKDIPVYCKDNNDITVIRMLRNPRITGYQQPIYKVTLDDGNIIKCTDNHKFILKDGSYKETKDLKENDSLMITSKWKTSWDEIFPTKVKSQDYWMLHNGKKLIFEHRLIYESLTNDFLKKGEIIHHIDFIGIHNNVLNLKKMKKKDHDKYHDISGDNNPIIKWYNNCTKEERLGYLKKMSTRTSGFNNGRAYNISNDDILEEMKKWVIDNNRVLSTNLWQKYAKEKNLIQGFTSFRGSLVNLINKANIECGYNNIDITNSYVKRRYNEYLDQLENSDLEIIWNGICSEVIKKCENCGKEFRVSFSHREQSFCSLLCSNKIKAVTLRGKQVIKKLKERKIKYNKFLDFFSKYVNEYKLIPSNEEVKNIIKLAGGKDFRTYQFYSYQKFLNKLSKDFKIDIINIKKFRYDYDKSYSKKKAEELIDHGFIYNHKVLSVEFIGYEDVYNGTVDDFHNYGIVLNKKETKSGKDKLEFIFTKQCGEQVLMANEACNLGALNLVSFVVDEFINPKFNFKELRETIKVGIRYLDNVLDRTDFPLEKIRDRVLNGRRIGLGFTGLADMFAMMKIVYGSKQSKKFSEKLSKFIMMCSYLESINIAKEKGSFSLFNEKYLEGEFIKQLPKFIQDRIKQFGIRNSVILTCAPTGTISFSIGQNCSSGIEPIFSLEYNRRIRIDGKDEFKEEKVYDYAWLEYCKIHSDIPDYFITSEKINPYDALDIQAIFQKYIDASISRTINLPLDITIKEYQKLFIYAYKKGLKGFTTFNPNGSMKGILEYNIPRKNEEQSYIKRIDAPKRPIELNCDIYQIIFKDQKFIILIGLYNGSIYEIFVDDDSENKINVGKHKNGIIRKIQKGRYDLIIKNGEEKTIVENLSKNFGGTYGILARFISMSLRHGTPLQFIVDQLSKAKEFLGFEKSVSRVLKHYIKDGEKVLSNNVCKECKGELVYKDGCISCKECGWSKCS